ncbi:MAG: hypothetical protein IJO72_04350 [Oscillospiraceae bacterium]|nr:hypothetical protein [Oscillospiraceae bacterium]
MKKIVCFILFVSLILVTAGCAVEDTSAKGNALFTDEFFSDVVEIRDTNCGRVTREDEEMTAVITYLKSLELMPSNEHLATTDDDGNPLYGPDLLAFLMNDGSEITFYRNHAMFTGPDKTSYVVEDENHNLNIGLKEAFGDCIDNW